MKVLTASQMYTYEQHIIQDKGIPSIVLMECAARAIVRQMKQTITKEAKVLVVAGGGNDGGDGIAVGRLLHNEGYAVEILVIGNPDHYSEQNQLQQKIARAYQAKIETESARVDFTAATVFVDALFGIGLSRAIKGEALAAVEKINQKQDASVFAIDVPSGISAVNGEKLGPCVKADETITFGFYKQGMEKVALKHYFGKITVDNIGFFYEE